VHVWASVGLCLQWCAFTGLDTLIRLQTVDMANGSGIRLDHILAFIEETCEGRWINPVLTNYYWERALIGWNSTHHWEAQ